MLTIAFSSDGCRVIGLVTDGGQSTIAVLVVIARERRRGLRSEAWILVVQLQLIDRLALYSPAERLLFWGWHWRFE